MMAVSKAARKAGRMVGNWAASMVEPTVAVTAVHLVVQKAVC